MTLPKIIGVMAATSEGIIGKDGGLPWSYPDELDHFRALTKGHVVIMGRKTFETAPQRLWDERTPLVLSRASSFKTANVSVVMGLNDCFSLIEKAYNHRTLYMVGGAEIAHLFLKDNLISEFILTRIKQPYQGDACLNLSLLEGWPEEIIKITPHYTIVHLYNPKGRI